ncbi:MAG: protein-methionine-sulfoxide reductase catalytic subunit MsrP [Kangiellaceae bacterium]|jgi:sulfoxide reductase catalytic subunit YedY|nr:protein-methionine-sulfoxide reductase catalytic subunit MsrP [Kangiellaceae bacterium]
MLIKNTKGSLNLNETESDVTSESVFINRRNLIKASAALALPVLSGVSSAKAKSPFSTPEPLTSEYTVTHYNNFYEFSLQKDGPAKLSKDFNPKPWSIAIEGEVEKPATLDLEDILKKQTIEERIYRLRCVEAWSMVVPWQGFQLSELIKMAKPTSKAKYVEFHTLLDPKQFPGQRRGTLGFFTLPWPYKEGLTIDEAMNPLAFLATGVYGKDLPAQNGAPVRLVVPWKYGFKSIKSIVKVRFVDKQPVTTWQESAPREYGFYANVNPDVDHPRWSQARERRIVDESLFGTKRIATRPFNGYGEQVAHLYKNLDLRRYY